MEQKRNSWAEAVEHAGEYLVNCDGIWISAYDDFDIIASQATIGLEILADLPGVNRVNIPVVDGGLIADIASTISALKPAAAVFGIQPSASPTAALSLQKGEAIDPFEHEPTTADGFTGGYGQVPFRVARTLRLSRSY